MSRLWLAVTTALALLSCQTTVAQTQSLMEGTWMGYVMAPGSNPFHATFEVSSSGGVIGINMSVGEWGETFPFQDVHFKDGAMRFWWQPLIRVDCELEPDRDGIYRGECWDSDGNTSPLVMAPPGVDPTHEAEAIVEAAEQARAENRKWAARHELDALPGPRGEMVDVGGYELNALIEGSGDVSVVLIADIGDDLRTWDYVVFDVKEFARVVAYSRSGIGYSQVSPLPVSLQQSARELRALLEAADVSPPYVVVGHVFGSVLTRVFASEHPDEVAGVVLIEPVHPEEGKHLRELNPPDWDAFWNQRTTLFDMAPQPVRAEFGLYEEIIEEARLDAGEFPDVPAAVISSIRVPDSALWVGDTPQGIELKVRLHERVAASFDRADHITTHDSGRYVQREKPDLVARAIRQVVDRVLAEDRP